MRRTMLGAAAATAMAMCAWAGEGPTSVPATRTGPLEVTGIKAVHRNGQTFVTWKDVAEGEEAAKYRYSLYRSDKPITPETLASAELCYQGVLYNSAKLFGSAFNPKDRLNPEKPTCILEEGGTPLPTWSGLAVRTVTANGKSYYAVVATDAKYEPLTKVVPGESAATEPVEETVAPIQPIKLYDSKKRGQYWQQTCITGEKGLPLTVSLHASSGGGGGASAWGDYYLYFATQEMGWRDGLPGVFSVEERRREKAGNYLVLNSRDAIERPEGTGAMETFWFGYFSAPAWAKDREPRAYPFTEKRMLWVMDWVMKKYEADPERVYAGGQSMGGWGSMTFAFRHPEIFAAVHPTLPRMRQRGLPGLVRLTKVDDALLPDGKTRYVDRMDMVRFVSERHGDLPFLGWSIGRYDGFATWKEQIDMVKALTAGHHGFAMAWNDGGHSEGAQPMGKVARYYGTDKFALHKSYPAFGNSSLDNDLGTGELDEKKKLKDGEKEGGINLGFIWTDLVEQADKWSVSLTNDLAKDEVTVDVTPRRCQAFKLKPGDVLKWTTSTGGSGQVTGDQWGLVTVEKVRIKAAQATVLTISR